VTTSSSSGSSTSGSTDELGDRPSIGTLLGDISSDLSELLRQELELAKAEARQSATRAGKGAGLLAGAATAGHLALVFVSVAVWWALGNSIGRGWSALVVTAIWLVIAAVLGLLGKKEVSEVRGLDRTTDTVKKIPPALKGHEEQNR